VTVIVTGATGFLGGRYAVSAISRGEKVIAVGRNRANLEKLEKSGATTIRCDLAVGFDAQAIETIKDIDQDDPIDCIVHSAALSSPFGSLSSFKAANIDATRNVCALAKCLPQARIINISTPAIYAEPRDRLSVCENDPLPKPINHYAATKRAAEIVVHETLGERAISLRPRGIYGAGDNALLPRLLSTAESGPLPLLRGGAAHTDITHVEDVIRAIDAARQATSDACGRAYNISGGQALQITEVIKAAAARSGTELKWRRLPVRLLLSASRLMEAWAALGGWKSEPLATPYSVGVLAFTQTLDITAAKTSLQWAPQVTFEEGVIEAFSGRDPWSTAQ